MQMRRKIFMAIGEFFLIALSTVTASLAASAPDALPRELAATLEHTMPGSAILAHSHVCAGAKATGQLGLVVQDKGQPSQIHAMFAAGSENHWVITELTRNIHYTNGSMPDFLSDYWDGQHFKSGFEARCANPTTDPNINIHANGEFMNESARFGSPTQVCFSSSDTYNDWTCFIANPATMKPVLSFVQMNAD